MTNRSILWIALTAGVTIAPATASADCSNGPTYAATVASNTVSLYADGNAPGDSGNYLLRQNEADGTVFVVTSFNSNTYDYVDECVSAGTYRYGFQTPFSCDDAGCGGEVPYFTEVTVTTTLPATCTRTTTTAPMQTAAAPPWDLNGAVTQYLSCPNHGGCSFRGNTHAGVRVFVLAMLGAGLVLLGRRVRRAKGRS